MTDNHRHFRPLIGCDPPGTVDLARDIFRALRCADGGVADARDPMQVGPRIVQVGP